MTPTSSPAPMRRAAMLVIVTDAGDLLLHHRDDKEGTVHPGRWAGFGGAVEDGETVGEAVRRKVRGETGLDVEAPIFLTERLDDDAAGDGRLISLYYVVGGIDVGDIDLQEGAGIGVHSVEAALALDLPPFLRQALQRDLVPLLVRRAV
jgi:8-oxo-dGTP pyrophosphatase MutT (NUDIX family)